MSRVEPYQTRREQHLQKIEAYFDNLPVGLYRQGRLLRNNLAFHYSDTGDFSSIITRADSYPPAELPLFTLDDFGFPEGDERAGLESSLFKAMFFTFAAIYTQEAILDESTFFDSDYIYLASELSRQADRQYARLIPDRSPFWIYHREFWRAYSEASLFGQGEISASLVKVTPEELLLGKDVFAPYKLIPGAAAALAGREDELPQLFAALDHLHITQRLLQDLSTLEADLDRGRYTYPLLLMMAKLGIPRGKAYDKQGVLAALVLFDTYSEVIQDCRSHIEKCWTEMEALGLPSYLAYLERVLTRVDELSAAQQLKKDAQVEGGQPLKSKAQPPRSTPAVDTLTKCIEMAQGYLLSDLSFKESWEVHRRGLAGAEQVSARFPSGLIIEILATHGHDMGAQVDSFLHHQRNTNFSYYDHPDLPYADSDNLGVLLRLYPFASEPEDYRKAVETPLSWMCASVAQSGRLPVWINASQAIEAMDVQSPSLIGEDCGTIEANLLIGLLEYDWDEYKEIVHKSAHQLLERFCHHGAGITVNYPRLYCLSTIKLLLTRLCSQEIDDALKELVREAAELYPQFLEVETRQYRITPQEAAFLILASLNSSSERHFKQRWITILLKNQRPDGSWYGEPVFFTPNRGELTTWHSSHQLTSAFCYHALKSYTVWKAAI